uniref:Ribosomal protein S10 n=1 Tax=Pleurosigma intermedium TaxID=197753 RepID=A0A8F9R319_9STRA|nr:ribosomal protein S10 [Pleurosigma sp. mgcode 4]
MITYDIKITSKNKQALTFFFLFLNKIKQPKINFLTNYEKQKTLIKKITILKSPHVNKKAQEQFEYRVFSKKISISSYNEMKFLIFLKKLKTKLFSEIKLKIKIFYNNKEKTKNNLLNPKNYYINSIIRKNQVNQKLQSKNIKIQPIKPCYKTKKYLKILDCYGELNIQNV